MIIYHSTYPVPPSIASTQHLYLNPKAHLSFYATPSKPNQPPPNVLPLFVSRYHCQEDRAEDRIHNIEKKVARTRHSGRKLIREAFWVQDKHLEDWGKAKP